MAVMAWENCFAPEIADLEALARRAFENLPGAFRALCGDMLIQVEDFPTDEVLTSLGLENPFDLLGLFQGIGLAQGGGLGQTGQMPNMVFLYRRPILDYWAEHEETLGAVVSHVLIHEIGHHFGLSDDDMEGLEREAD
ncbi:metallopeptidase family protein [Xanthobacter sp. TB0139]|uniref:metallopeptidase family protein n=1 Tax=Xanthobacter sp. TB0139 TaxID=3459178 RepID=UPI0040398BFE